MKSISSLLSWGGVLPTRPSEFGSLGKLLIPRGYYYYPLPEVPVTQNSGSLGELLKQILPTTSLKESSSSKDNLIEVRTKIIVGAMP